MQIWEHAKPRRRESLLIAMADLSEWPELVSCGCVKLCLGRHTPLHGELRALLVDSWRVRLDEAHIIGEKHRRLISTCLNVQYSCCIRLHHASYCHWTAWLPGLDSTGTRLCKSQAALARACAGLWISGQWFVRGRGGNFRTARFGDSAVESALMLKALCDRLARVAEALVSLSSP